MVEDRLASLGASTASSLHRKMISLSNSVVCTRTDIKTPHILEKPFVIASSKYQNKIVRKSDNVCPKAVSRELAPYRCLASSGLNILDRVKPWKWIGDRGAGRLRYCGGERRQARVRVGRVPFVSESSGAEQPTVAD